MKNRNIIAISVTVIICLLIVLIARIEKKNSENDAIVDLGDIGNELDLKNGDEQIATGVSQAAEENESLDTTKLLAYNANTDSSYLDSCIFLGDSRMVGLVLNGHLKSNQVLAKVGLSHTGALCEKYLSTSGKEYTFAEYLSEHQSQIVYICYGVNGINNGVTEEYKASYIHLVEMVMDYEPNSTIVISGVWPVDESGPYALTNASIDEFNQFLREYAVDNGFYYLDAEQLLKDSNGQMSAKYNSGDGLHYNEAANCNIKDYVIHHPVPLDTYIKNDFPKLNFVWDTRPKIEESVSNDSISDNDISANSIETYLISDSEVSNNVIELDEISEGVAADSTTISINDILIAE